MPKGVYSRNRLEDEPQTAEDSASVSTRAEETRRVRRRRDEGDLDRGARFKLAIPQEIQDQAKREGKTLRWVNDEGNRMHHMTVEDDWDVVQSDLVKPVPVSTSPDGKPVYARLCSKFQDWYDEDQRDKARILKEREKAVEQGAKADPDDKRSGDEYYVPKGNRISRGA